jgi:hypothetical protein
MVTLFKNTTVLVISAKCHSHADSIVDAKNNDMALRN